MLAYPLVGCDHISQIKIAKVFIQLRRVGMKENLLRSRIGLVPLAVMREGMMVRVQHPSGDGVLSRVLLRRRKSKVRGSDGRHAGSSDGR